MNNETLFITVVIIFIIIEFLLFIYFAHKSSKKNRHLQYEIAVKENADFPTAVEDGFIPTKFDQEILLSWEDLNRHKDAGNQIPMYSKVALFDFAEYYHKAKS